MDHFRLNSYLAPRLGGIKQKKFVLFIAEPQDDFFCFIPSSPEAKYEFYYIRIILLFYCPARKFFWFQFLFVPYESSRRKSPAPLVTALSTHSPPPTTPNPIEGLISISSKWWTRQSWHYCYLLIQQIIFLEKMINFVDSVWSLKFLSTQHILLYLFKCLKIHNKTQVRMNSALVTHYKWHWFAVQIDKPSIKFENNKN